jgi:hypothetical protein
LTASGLRPGTFSARRQKLAERRALLAPHGGQIGERLVEALGNGGLGGAPSLVALILVGHFHHALERENAVERRGRSLDLAFERLERCNHRGKHLLVDLHRRRHAFVLDGEIGIDSAARQLVRCTLSRRHLNGVPARRQPQPHVETLGIDRFDFPTPSVGARHAMAAREAGHARKRHAHTVSLLSKSAATLAAAFDDC